jgi:hypothetical protein
MTSVIFIDPHPGKLTRRGNVTRLRARAIDLDALAADVGTGEPGRWHIRARHGGVVPNCYNYPAWTEAAVAVMDPQGRVVIWGVERIRANKATLSGACRAVLPCAADIFDKRVPAGSVRERASWADVKVEHRRELVLRTAAGDALVRLGGMNEVARLSCGELEAILAHPDNRPAYTEAA